MTFDQRISSVEQLIGCSLPSGYVEFLRNYRATQTSEVRVVSTNPDYWAVRSLFELSDGRETVQLDGLLKLVGDILPPSMVPVAEDEAGNLFLLGCSAGASGGQVFWWNHERDPADLRVESVAESFEAFLGSLVPETD